MATVTDIKFESHLQDLLRALPEQKKVGLKAIGYAGETNAKMEITKAIYDKPESPNYKRTGNLRNSLTHAETEDAVYIGSNLEYAAPVELGTSRMRPRPYLRPAVENYKDQYKNLLIDALKG